MLLVTLALLLLSSPLAHVGGQEDFYPDITTEYAGTALLRDNAVDMYLWEVNGEISAALSAGQRVLSAISEGKNNGSIALKNVNFNSSRCTTGDGTVGVDQEGNIYISECGASVTLTSIRSLMENVTQSAKAACSKYGVTLPINELVPTLDVCGDYGIRVDMGPDGLVISDCVTSFGLAQFVYGVLSFRALMREIDVVRQGTYYDNLLQSPLSGAFSYFGYPTLNGTSAAAIRDGIISCTPSTGWQADNAVSPTNARKLDIDFASYEVRPTGFQMISSLGCSSSSPANWVSLVGTSPNGMSIFSRNGISTSTWFNVTFTPPTSFYKTLTFFFPNQSSVQVSEIQMSGYIRKIF